MAITYNVSKCKNGWGVYVRALSGDDLRAIASTVTHSVVRVTSGRLARKRSKLSAKNFINRIKLEPTEIQHDRLRNIWIKIAPDRYRVVRVQNLKLFRETHPGHYIPQLTTINRDYAEKAALFYSEREKESFFKKTKTFYLKLPYNTDTKQLNTI